MINNLTPSGGVWIIEIVIGIAFLIVANYVLKRILKYFRARSLSRAHDWREKLDRIIYRPLHFVLWIVGIAYIIDVFGQRFGFFAFLGYLRPMRDAAVICCLAWLLERWKREVQHSIVARNQQGHRAIDAGMAHLIGRLLSITIIVITLLIVLQILGLNIVPLLAFGGIGIAALGFAGKDVIANFFGGLMLYITRPFMIGDLICLEDRGIEGTVEEIGWYLTAVRDKEKRPVYLPNSIFSTMLVINCSRMSHRRIEETIGIRYKDFSKIKSITDDIRNEIAAHPAIDTHLPILVFFNAFKEYSLDIHIDVYCLATRYDEYLAVKQEILMAIQKIVDEQGAQMPFPTTTLDIPQEVKI